MPATVTDQIPDVQLVTNISLPNVEPDLPFGSVDEEVELPIGGALLNVVAQNQNITSQLAGTSDPVANVHDEDIDASNFSTRTDTLGFEKIDIIPATTTSGNFESAAVDPLLFSPESVRPLPKAGQRKQSKRGRKKRMSTVLTDTPAKEALEREQNEANLKKVKKNFQTDAKISASSAKPSKKKKRANTPVPSTSGTRKKTQVPKTKKNKQNKNQADSSIEEEWFCIVCCEPYSNSKSGENWISCYMCKQWSHEECTPGTHPFVCHHCDPD